MPDMNINTTTPSPLVPPTPAPPPPAAPPHNEQGDIIIPTPPAPPHNEQGDVGTLMTPLATGMRINRGADDPAGLIASEGLRARLSALEAESRAYERADAVANVADGALAEISDLLSGANAAAVALANTAGMSQAERDAHQMEVDSARQSIDRIASTTTFNGQKLLDGGMTLRSGDAALEIGRIRVDGSDQESLRSAIEQVATMRGEIGAFQKNTIGAQARSTSAAFINMSAAESMIRDTDYGAAGSELARALVLAASRRAVQSLANGSNTGGLRLLG